MTKRKYTYQRGIKAIYGTGWAAIPDQVVDNVEYYSTTSFPIIRGDGKTTRALILKEKFTLGKSSFFVVVNENRHLRHVERCPHCRQTIKG